VSDDRKARLAAMESAWNQTEAPSGDRPKKEYEPIPDGEYQARIELFDFHESKKDGSLSLRTQFEIIGPTRDGAKVSCFHDLEKPERLKWTRMHLELLGINVHSFQELEAALPSALDKVAEIALKTRTGNNGTDYQNVYLNRVLEGVTASAQMPRTDDTPPPPTDADQPAPKDDPHLDEIPF
jgi:hypothetical protein